MGSFKELTSMKEMESFIKDNDLSFIYVTMPNCSVCKGLKPQIETIFLKYPHVHTRTIDASKVTAIAGQYNIFTAPVLILFVKGKEYLREARFVQTQVFDEKISRIYKNMVGS